MIDAFGDDTALLLIDVQRGVDDLAHWGGPTGRRNNPAAESNMARLLAEWRAVGYPVIFTMHDSQEAASPLKLSLSSGRLKPGFQPVDAEQVVIKQVNGAFFGTDLASRLEHMGARRLVLAGFFTNMCVETTARTAGNLGYDTYLCHDACATTNRIGPDGTDHDPDVVHRLSVASLHGEFCTAIATDAAIGLLHGADLKLSRAQGNEP